MKQVDNELQQPDVQIDNDNVQTHSDVDSNVDSEHESKADLEVNQRLNGYQLARDREKRQIRPLVTFDDEVSLLTTQSLIENEPKSFKDAMNSKDSNHWPIATQDEMKSLRRIKHRFWLKDLKEKGLLIVNGSLKLKKENKMTMILDIKPDLWLYALLKKRGYISMKSFFRFLKYF